MNKKHDRLLKVFLSAAFLLGSMGLSAQTVTKTFRNASLRSVLEEIKHQTKLSVIYNVDDVKTAGKVTASFKDAPVGTVLNEVLGSGLSYSINGKMITIHKRNARPVRQKQKSSTAPKQSVKGQVLDENGEPIIGATIRVKGEKEATVTDIDGNFTINAANGAELEVSYLGYVTKSVAANGDFVGVKMSQNTQALNEVVVTALGIKKEAKALSYNVQQLNSDDITGVKDANFMNALAGKVAGVEISSSSSGIGGGVKVVMRGAKSISNNNNVLYVIDGIPMPSLQTTQPN